MFNFNCNFLEKVWEVVIGLIKVIECYGVIYIVFKLKIKKKKKLI